MSRYQAFKGASREALSTKALLCSRYLPALECNESLRHAKAEGKTTACHHWTDPETGSPLRLLFGWWLVLHRHCNRIEQRSQFDSPARSWLQQLLAL